MASYQSRQRDPLFDSTTQAALEKRSRELVGLALIVTGALFAVVIGTYSPDDPSWISATDAPVQNWLGHFGASVAAPLMMVIGLGSWVIAATLIAAGARFVFHYGQDRVIGRAMFAPVVMVVASVYAATLAPAQDWPANFGMGGLFGDTVLGVLLTILPFGTVFGVKLLSFLAAVLLVALLTFLLGFTRPELRKGLRFVMLGTVLIYDFVLRMMGRGAALSAQGAHVATAAVQARRAQSRMFADPQVTEDIVSRPQPVVSSDFESRLRAAAVVRARPAFGAEEPPVTTGQIPAAPPPLTAPMRNMAPEPAPSTGGFLSGLLRRNDPMPQPELVTPEPRLTDAEPVADTARVSARIADAIRSRTTPPSPTGVRIEPSLTAGRGPKPLVYAPYPPLVTPEPQQDDAIFEDDDNDDDDDAPYLAAPHTPIPSVPSFVEPRTVVQHPPKRPVQPSRQAVAEAQPALKFDDPYADYERPPLSLLTNPVEITRHHLSDESLSENARMLESVLDDYGVKGDIIAVRPGPVVTMYELEPAPGLKASRVIGLADDIARSMSALSARVSTVPGRSVIGIELPNENREKVVLREILSHRDFGDGNQKLPLALGKDIGGEPIIANLAKMPHLLIAGTTGSGKSVAINTMILSLLYKLTPQECRMIMIDPKMLELSVYDGIPHLLSPVVTDPKKAVVALKWVVGEMEERYRKMSKMGVRNIDGFNGRVKEALSKGEMFSRTVQTGFDDETGDPIFETEEFQPEVLPYIVVIVDEMADLMMVAGKEIEACIQRLAQMARASGIHLIMATQRPSVDVITGTIKANFPTRISFQVTSKIDSRTILGEMGAEQLLGMGDMLYMAGGSKIMRVHGPFVSDEEVEEIVNHLKGFGPPEYMSGVVEGPSDDHESSIDLVLGLGDGSDLENALYDTAVAIVIKDRKCSTSYIQRKLAIGYNKAARLVEQMEDEGVVSSANHVGKREVLVPEQH